MNFNNIEVVRIERQLSADVIYPKNLTWDVTKDGSLPFAIQQELRAGANTVRVMKYKSTESILPASAPVPAPAPEPKVVEETEAEMEALLKSEAEAETAKKNQEEAIAKIRAAEFEREETRMAEKEAEANVEPEPIKEAKVKEKIEATAAVIPGSKKPLLRLKGKIKL